MTCVGDAVLPWSIEWHCLQARIRTDHSIAIPLAKRALASFTKQGFLYISHDLSVARHLCDRVAIMFHGRTVDEGLARDIHKSRKHDIHAGCF
jgi:ABC-type glutathione transport system ATPase component